MAPRPLLRLGVRSLLVHKLRSVLSILGVFFGVGAVVAMSSVGEGAREEALAQVGSLGIDTITVRQTPPAEGSDPKAPELLLQDAASLDKVVPQVLAVAPVREATLEAQSRAGRHMEVDAVGTTPAYGVASRLPLAGGRFLTDLDLEDKKRAAVLGAWVASGLYPLEDARGRSIQIGGDWFEVVGILAARGTPKAKGGPIRSRDVNKAVFVPLPALDRGEGPPDGIDEIVVRVRSGEAVGPAAQVVKEVLGRRTGSAPLEILIPREILRQKQSTQRIFNVVTGAVAGISLLVGGIGIMNIMLASVAERTREVGIRRAVGATRRDVAVQFLTEAALLTVTGGAFGALVGILGSVLIQRFADWPTALSPEMLILALATALAVGIGFGLYPAWRAAQLEPMEALRHE